MKLVYVEDGLDEYNESDAEQLDECHGYGWSMGKESEMRKAADQRQGELIGEVRTVRELRFRQEKQRETSSE